METFISWNNKIINKTNDYNWEAIIRNKYFDQCIDKEIDIEFCDVNECIVGGASTKLKEYKIEILDLYSYKDKYKLHINNNLIVIYSEIKLISGIVQLIKDNGAVSFISLSDGSNIKDNIKDNAYDKEIIDNVIAFAENFECVDCPLYPKEYDKDCLIAECPFDKISEILKKL